MFGRGLQGLVVNVAPDRSGSAVFRPDIAVGEADLAPDRLFAARAAQPQDLGRHLVALIPIEAGIALGDGGYRRAVVERVEQLSCNLGCIHVRNKYLPQRHRDKKRIKWCEGTLVYSRKMPTVRGEPVEP